MKDPSNPERFKNILVSRSGLVECLQGALKARVKDPALAFLNGLIDLVFTQEELSEASGLGLKGPKKDKALNKEKVNAIRGLYFFCI